MVANDRHMSGALEESMTVGFAQTCLNTAVCRWRAKMMLSAESINIFLSARALVELIGTDDLHNVMSLVLILFHKGFTIEDATVPLWRLQRCKVDRGGRASL